ncbi:manganese transport protein [Propionicimonas paludicola]|uniref:Manganese transport protein n=1 Tax=Propionicimonas paludicola TaxID=185243 RepID=A0A2A9CS58_9ACTN|nr:Nramp family divalent metal transporter [Propionicimonas paludicola]PFG16442.1 manganese transport protein [Propionicimonas paludicola]
MHQPTANQPSRRGALAWALGSLGPAFVASIAYVDPGNVAANASGGARYGYALVWVLALASLMAMVIQYQSAKLGLVTGLTLPQAIAARFTGRSRPIFTWGYPLQAFAIAIATDLAEVVGGALGLYLLFGIPLWLGGIIVGLVSVILLRLLRSNGERGFELGVGAVLAVIVAGFLGALWFRPPDPMATLAGLIPQLPDHGAWPLIAAMLGATVMPHAIYLHSALAIDRFRPGGGELDQPLPRLLRLQRVDVFAALLISGTVNVSMLLLGATTLAGTGGDTIEAAHATLNADLGPLAAGIFAVGLIASGIGSAVVGTHAGSRILKDLNVWHVAPTARRLITVLPAVVLLLFGLPPTDVLVWSQVVLSFGVALAAAPLALVTGDRRMMGDYVDRPLSRVLNWTIVATVVALNLMMIWWALTPVLAG